MAGEMNRGLEESLAVVSTHDVAIGEEVEGGVVTNYDLTNKMRDVYSPGPEGKVYSDAEFAEKFNKWMLKTTGIKERSWSNVPLETLAEVAAREAMYKAGWVSEDINYLIVANSTEPQQTPSLGDRVAAQLNCPGAKVFTINKACAGMIYAFEMVHLLASSSKERGSNAVIVAVEKCQDYADWSIATNGPLWGTGSAAACVSIRRNEAPALLYVFNPVTGLLPSKELGRDPKTGLYFVRCGKEGMDLVAKLMADSIRKASGEIQPDELKFVGPVYACIT
ncbi:hypothetical protein HYT58_00565 [Candidatus Woesearchaeota archaeon]|nr:hypothetical protein [Candidatus Woesearchaeota archaeon]